MQFNPGVNDISGQILGQGVAGAAKTRADMMSQMGQDIGGAIESIGGALTNSLEFNNMGDSAYEALGAIGEMYPGMKGVYTSLGKMDPRTRRLAAVSITQNLGAVSQLGIAGMRDSTQQAGQQLDRDRPFIDASLKNLGNTAAGNIPYGGSPSQDPANTVPLPTGPSASVDQVGTPAAVAASGGAGKMSPQDWQAMRADFISRGRRDPGPYPY
jgi:hypothetical protein